MIGNYAIEEELVAQCSSKLYIVRDVRNGYKYVMKSIRLNSEFNNETNKTKHEVSLQNQMDSPYVLPIYDAFYFNNSYNILTKFCRYGDLMSVITKKTISLSYENRINIAYQMISAVNYLHSRGIAHFDIKLDNFIIYDIGDDGTPLIALIDFGNAKQIWNASVRWRVCGTNPYCPPEYFQKANLDRRFDLFSFGVSISNIFTGIRLFDPNCSQSGICEEVMNMLTDDIKQIVLNLIHEDPNSRMETDDLLVSPVFANVPSYIVELGINKENEVFGPLYESSSYSEFEF